MGYGFAEFDEMCNRWIANHPGEDVSYGELFADWLAGKTGEVVIGGPAGEAPTVVAIPDESALDDLTEQGSNSHGLGT